MQILARFIVLALATATFISGGSLALAQYPEGLKRSYELPPPPGSLGLNLRPLRDDPKDKFGLPPSVQGLRVINVVVDYPAAKAGLVIGDVITRFGNVETITLQHFFESLSELRNNGQLNIPVSLFNIETKTSRQITLQLEVFPPASFVSPLSPEHLSGDQITAMFVVAISDFVLKNCPNFFVDTAKQTELMRSFNADASSMRENRFYKERLGMYNAQAIERGKNKACDEIMRSTYDDTFGPHKITRLINRKL